MAAENERQRLEREAENVTQPPPEPTVEPPPLSLGDVGDATVPTTSTEGQFEGQWDPKSKTYKFDGGGSDQPTTTETTATQNVAAGKLAMGDRSNLSLSEEVSEELKRTIQNQDYRLPEEVSADIRARAKKSLGEAADKLTSSVALDAQRRGVTFGDARTAGMWDVADYLTDQQATLERGISADEASKYQQNRYNYLSLGGTTGQAERTFGLQTSDRTGTLDGQPTLEGRRLSLLEEGQTFNQNLALAQQLGFYTDPTSGTTTLTLGGRQMDLSEATSELSNAIARAQQTGDFTDPVSGETVQTLQSKLAYAQQLGTLNDQRTLARQAEDRADLQTEVEYGEDGLAQQRVDNTRGYLELAIEEARAGRTANSIDTLMRLLGLIGGVPGVVDNGSDLVKWVKEFVDDKG